MARKYLPRGLTKAEKRSPALRKKLARCIKAVEKSSCPKKALRKDGTYNYALCRANPVAVCRARLKK